MKKNNNCYIATTDPVHYKVYNKDEVEIMFGLDYLEDYGHEIPEDLLKRYKLAYIQFWNIQGELEKYKEIK